MSHWLSAPDGRDGEAEIHDDRVSAIEHLLGAAVEAVREGQTGSDETRLDGITVSVALEAASVIARSLTDDNLFLVPGERRIRWATLGPKAPAGGAEEAA